MNHQTLTLLTLATLAGAASAHTWKAGEQPVFNEALRVHILADWEKNHGEKQSTTPLVAANGVQTSVGKAPAKATPFTAFAPKVNVKWDKDFLYIESNGIPDHNMMVGITAWQQQVPLTQPYSGDNAWRLPLKPVPAKTPAVIEDHFLRGAIAIGVNGIPIFNPQNNRGEISYEIGELDQWGGHCGRADDYHYHIAPLHLQSVVGKDQPIAFAMDGYPIYGLTEPDGSPIGKLDECHGHEDAKLGYHYHASTKRPYLQSAFHGEVVEVDGQADPQPRAQGVREALTALRGAEITGFESTGSNSYKLSYSVNGDKRSVAYSINSDGTYPFEFDNGREGKSKEVYTARQGGGGKGGPGGPGGPDGKGKSKGKGKGKGMRPEDAPPPPPGEERRPPRPQNASAMMDLNGDGTVSAIEFADAAKRDFAKNNRGSTLADAMAKARTAFTTMDRNHDGQLDAGELASPAESAPATPGRSTDGFVLTSTEVEIGGNLPVDFTGDGSGATLPLSWSGAPAGTKSYALIMDHLAPGDEMKSYWVMWDIPANVTSLPKNVQGVGKVGSGFKGAAGYEPPHSKGPGAKTYVLHVYALSEEPKIKGSAASVSREVLLSAIEDKILAKADLSVVYTRGGNGGKEERQKPMAEGRPQEPRPPAAPEGGNPKGGQRKPWMQMHGAELDADHDGVVTLTEMANDMKIAAAKYDGNQDNNITPAEIDAAGDIREGAAFAGFIYRHAADLDANNDSLLSSAELGDAVKFIFGTADQDHDSRITTAEAQNAPNAPFGNPPPRNDNQPPPSASNTPAPEPESRAVAAGTQLGQAPGGGKGKGKGKGKGGPPGLIKPSIADTMKLNVYADNWFMLYVNGRLVAVDPIQFTPHNVVSVDFLPEYPMTIAVLAKDNADPKTGMEYGTSIGDGGFILKFGDGTVTNATWKAKNFFHGPINGDTANPKVRQEPLPANWWATDFNDSTWAHAKEFTVEEVDPKQPYFDNDFEGAKFIWTNDIALDNTIIFRTKIEKPEWKQRWNTKPDLDVSGVPLR